MRTAFAALVSFFVVVGIIAFGFIFVVSGGNVRDWLQTELLRLSLSRRQDDLARPISNDDTPIRFDVATGESPRTIAQNLSDQNLIIDSDLFVDYLRVEDLDVELEAGIYFPNQTQTIPEIAQMLTDSRNSHINFTIIEGWRLEEIASAIDQTALFIFTGEEFLNAVRGGSVFDANFSQFVGLPAGASLEGFMVPDTYILPPRITAEGLRDKLLETFTANFDPQMQQDALARGYTIYDIVTLASIIEREAVWKDEESLISSVYHNRLRDGQLLQADPTVQYGLNGARGDWWANITVADYQGVTSPYNTYLYPGLPPGPIANPGISAIRAAIYPEQTSYFYFRAACDGSSYHQFAETFEEHLGNACNAQ